MDSSGPRWLSISPTFGDAFRLKPHHVYSPLVCAGLCPVTHSNGSYSHQDLPLWPYASTWQVKFSLGVGLLYLAKWSMVNKRLSAPSVRRGFDVTLSASRDTVPPPPTLRSRVTAAPPSITPLPRASTKPRLPKPVWGAAPRNFGAGSSETVTLSLQSPTSLHALYIIRSTFDSVVDAYENNSDLGPE